MKKIFILIFIIAISNGCTPYFTPERYANPRHKFESGSRKYERKMRRLERQSKPTIDPLRWS
jgi:hypothetical protein